MLRGHAAYRITAARAVLGAMLGAILVVTGGCERKKAPVNGIGGFVLGKTQLGQLNGRCMDASDPALMLCPSVAGVALGNQHADISLYFGGKTVDAKLVEMVLDVNACQPEKLRAWLVETMGKPAGEGGKRVFWSNEQVFISAGLPAEPRRCEINFVAVGDTARIERLKGGAK